VLDNATRWLSQYYMIDRALDFQVIYDEFMAKAKRLFVGKGTVNKLPPCLESNSLMTDNDWRVLAAFKEVLEDFHYVIKSLQGDGKKRKRRGGVEETMGLMAEVTEAFEFLLKRLETAKERIHDYPESKQFAVNINLGWAKLDKYYSHLSDSPVYYAAAALNPALRWQWFESTWDLEDGKAWVQDAKRAVQRLWDEEYRDLEPTMASKQSEEGPAQKKRKTNLSNWDRYKESNRRSQTPTSASSPVAIVNPTIDEYAHWQATRFPTDSAVDDPIQYWKDRVDLYPRLSRMALDVMTVPAMSAEVERLFSAVGLMVTPLRNRLDASTIGLIQTLRSWLKAGIIDSLDDILLDDGLLAGLLEEEGQFNSVAEDDDMDD